MTKKTTRAEEYSGGRPTLFLVLELGWSDWKLGFSTGMGQKLRSRRMPARDRVRLQLEISQAKQRFNLPPGAPVATICTWRAANASSRDRGPCPTADDRLVEVCGIRSRS